MSLTILVRQQHQQRSLALATDTHALVFRQRPPAAATGRHHHPHQPPASPPACMVEFARRDALDLRDYRSLRPSGSGVYGTLGLVNIGADVFLCVITGASRVAAVRPGENVQSIVSVEFYGINRADLDQEQLHPHGRHRYGLDDDDDDADTYAHDDDDDDDGGYDSRDTSLEHPCLALQKVLAGGTFYYSVDFDLTNSLQHRSSKESAFDVDGHDEGFLWNSYMIGPLIQFRSRLAAEDRRALDASRILTSAIRGYVSTLTVPASMSPLRAVGSNLPSTLTLISRLSCRRAGTRFNSRGIDDDGNVANFVETETVYWFPSGLCFSYTQVRGSVPVFWEQAAGLLPQQQKIHLTRSPEATQPAFDRHLEDLELKYGTVHVLNLLSDAKPGEVELTARYLLHTRQCSLNRRHPRAQADHALLRYSSFDFHAETKGAAGYEAAGSVRLLIRATAEAFAYFLIDAVDEPDPTTGLAARRSLVVLQQGGVFRTNCLDCLDRTNLIQTIVSQMALESFLRHRDESAPSDFYLRHSTLWADNGDALSKIYAGTGALKSSFTRHGRMSLAGALADARKSATRLYINNFVDKGRQNVVDTLLGRLVGQAPVQLYDPVNDHVNAEMSKRANEFSRSETIDIWVGTFNVNGKGHGITDDDLSPWLWPDKSRMRRPADIVAVAFQEIVELSPQQIMSTDPARRQGWEDAVKHTLNRHAREVGSEEYVLLRSGQLVGAALVIFVRSAILKSIKDVEGSVKKTGLSGMAGNKGAVAIRMDVASTRVCFVTAHLAAGFANYDERNRDYATISHGLRFQRNRSVEDHDTIVWMGDFNYRIGLGRERVCGLIEAGDLDTLYGSDQLNLQMGAASAFPFYSEGRIDFLPTYKYDNGTDEYDTSEKQRIPAWCDRVLWKGGNLRQIAYGSAPLRFSDHRPVYATFECTVSVVDEHARAGLMREAYGRRRSEIAGAAASGAAEDTEDDESPGFEPIAPGLPPASSDRRRWWLDNGLPARSTIAEAHDGHLPNPQRSSNPFLPSDEPDWVPMPGKASGPERGRRSTAGAAFGTAAPVKPPRPGEGEAQRPASTASESRRKPAPPIPKKPSTLSTAGSQQNITDGDFIPTPAPRKGTGSGTQQRTGGPPAAAAPPGPRGSPRDILTGDGEEEQEDGAKGIPSLQPLRPG